MPNPFKDETEISFYLNNPEQVSLVVYDLMGNKIDILINNEMIDMVIFNVSACLYGCFFMYELVILELV